MREERILHIERTWNVQEIAWFVSVARGIDNPVTLEHQSSTANGKGLLGMVSLMMNVNAGEAVRLIVTGPDCSDAMAVLLDHLPMDVSTEPPSEEKGVVL